jgi:hypothetical protein
VSRQNTTGHIMLNLSDNLTGLLEVTSFNMTDKFSLEAYEVQFELVLQVPDAKKHFHEFLKSSLVRSVPAQLTTKTRTKIVFYF